MTKPTDVSAALSRHRDLLADGYQYVGPDLDEDDQVITDVKIAEGGKGLYFRTARNRFNLHDLLATMPKRHTTPPQ